ncbi:hypothetical protein [Ignatzschineria cameli]|uniref:hypothetical protein n=1 Tax=Ignatzschineria cameli TaxID=2182793 RepID=UPI000D619AF8|nr:hypothetical protein [Ignatzschineria cameli]PWD85901.1 hypothetical protein DC080_03820 [Ignatzschineria cameli]
MLSVFQSIMMFKKSLSRTVALLAIAGASLISPIASAQTVPIENFKTCLLENTSEVDQVELAQWVYLAISAHPHLTAYTAITPAERRLANQRVARLYERLVTQDCKIALAMLVVTDQVEAGVEAGFSALGEVAMLSLLEDESVLESIEEYVQYLDVEKFTELFNIDN